MPTSATQSTEVPVEAVEALAKRLFDSISESRKSWHMQGAKVRAHYRDATQKHLAAVAPILRKQGADQERQRLAHGGEPDISPGDVIAAKPDGTITLDDGITTWNPSRAT